MSKPKFRVGQVVAYLQRDGKTVDVYGKIVRRARGRDGPHIMLGSGHTNHESWFRSLTTREIGPRPKRAPHRTVTGRAEKGKR
jgi:hypothetical protein